MTTLTDMLVQLDSLKRPLCPREMRSWIERVQLKRWEMEDLFRFSQDAYCRETIGRGQCFEVLALGWLPGQASPIHNHDGSHCLVRVITGEATETSYDATADGGVQLAETNIYPEGSIFGNGVGRDIHKVRNGSRTYLRTLHIYSPPLLQMQQFDEPGQYPPLCASHLG